MISIRLLRTTLCALLTGGAFCIAFSLPAEGQVKTTTTTTHGTATKQVKIVQGEIVYVNGNDVVLKMADGTLRHFPDVPDNVTFMIDGRPVNVHDAKVGMKIEQQTITTTAPKVITTVQTVSGKVFRVSPPNWVILTMDNGQNQQFKIPKGQKFMIDGQETDAFGLRKGMRVSAQKVTEVPESVISQQIERTGIAPPPPPAPQADTPILVVLAVPIPPPQPASSEAADAEPTPTKLPTTASEVPLIGLLGALLCGFSLATMAIRAISLRHPRFRG